jgi:hypothetical protein
MQIGNTCKCFLAAAALLFTACGKQERLEAVRFAKTVAAAQGNFTSAGAIEKEFVENARAWSGGIVGYGSGRAEELDQNAAVAAELAKSVVAASAQLSQIRQAIDAQALSEEYPRSVRNTLTTQLTRRQRMLQDARVLLENAAAEFRHYREAKLSAAETYPDGVAKLAAMLTSYKPPENAVADALTALRTKYKLADTEI